MKLGGILSEKVSRRREWNAKLNKGENGAQTYIMFSPRFPFPCCSGYGKRVCAIPLGRRKPTRGSLRGRAKDRALDGLFLKKVGKYFKIFEKVGKGRKRFQKIGQTFREVFSRSFL